jgi:hypothetical protein
MEAPPPNETSPRTCGGCTLCCRFFSVPELRKPEGEWCVHCTATGCGIHPTRPRSCRNFECFWLMDESFPEDLRPDRCGIVAAFNGDDHGSVVLHLDPDRPDALAHPPGAELLEAVLTAFDPVFVVCGDDRTMIRRGEGRAPV